MRSPPSSLEAIEHNRISNRYYLSMVSNHFIECENDNCNVGEPEKSFCPKYVFKTPDKSKFRNTSVPKNLSIAFVRCTDIIMTDTSYDLESSKLQNKKCQQERQPCCKTC